MLCNISILKELWTTSASSPILVQKCWDVWNISSVCLCSNCILNLATSTHFTKKYGFFFHFLFTEVNFIKWLPLLWLLNLAPSTIYSSPMKNSEWAVWQSGRASTASFHRCRRLFWTLHPTIYSCNNNNITFVFKTFVRDKPIQHNLDKTNKLSSKQNQVKIGTDLTVLSIVGNRLLQSDFLLCIRLLVLRLSSYVRRRS